MQISCSLRRQLLELTAQGGKGADQARGARLRAWAAQHRLLQDHDRARMLTVGPTEPGKRMLEQCEEAYRCAAGERRLHRQARERSGRRVRQRIAAGSSTGTFQRSSAASTRRARARSGVTRAAVLPGLSTASRKAMAMARASSPALAASMTDMVSSARSVSGIRHQRAAAGGGGRRPQRFAHEVLALMPPARAEHGDLLRVMPIRCSSARMANCG